MNALRLACALSVILATAAPPTLAAQDSTDAPFAVCQWFRGDANKVIDRALGHGYRVVITPRPRAEYVCRRQIIDARRRVRFSFSAFATSVVDTKTDLDNDGDPDILLEIDQGGGNRCCRVLHAITLDGAPRELWNAGPMAVFVERSAIGTILRFTHAFYNLGPSMAESPVIERVLRPTVKGMTDVTSRFCDEILARDSVSAREQLALEARHRLLVATTDSLATFETRRALRLHAHAPAGCLRKNRRSDGIDPVDRAGVAAA